MRLAENKPIVTHNSEYAAVHAVAYNLKPEEQTDQQVFQQYANTLGDHIADKLTRKIFRKVPPSYIRTLKDAMEEGEQLEQVYRQTELARSERISMRETTMSDSVNMISDVSSIEYPDSPRGGRVQQYNETTPIPKSKQRQQLQQQQQSVQHFEPIPKWLQTPQEVQAPELLAKEKCAVRV